jgi:hypothetical protein
MKNTYYRVLGEIEGETYRAEIYPKEKVILCSSGIFGGLLKQANTERRAADIAKRALTEHRIPVILTKVPLFKGWLVVEVQTRFKDILLTSVKGLKTCGKGLTADYKHLSDEERAVVEPLLPGFIDRLKTEKMGTPSPNAQR